MKPVITIALRELKSNFVTPLAYVVITGFLLLSGFFFFSLLQQFNGVLAQASLMPEMTPNINQWVITPYLRTLEIILLFLIPILTMRAIADEKQSGTFELLFTSPITVNQIVLGKFIGVSLVILIMLGLSSVFFLALIPFANPEIPPMLVGFIGVILFSMSFTGLGVAISACTKNQTVAGVSSLVIFLLFYAIDAPAAHFGEIGAYVLGYLAPANHMELITKGVISSTDLVYFFSVMFLGLFAANRILDAERWRS